MLCKQTTEEEPVEFAVDNVDRCNRSANCARTVGLDISTRIGSGTAVGCGDFADPEVEGGHCMTRVTTVATQYWESHPPSGPENDALLATITTTTTESRENGPIVTGETTCGEPTSDPVPDGDPPASYDYTTLAGDPEVSYDGCWTEAEVCAAATADIAFGDWSEWEPYMVGDEQWSIDIDSGGALLSIYAASASRGYALETRVRVRGAFPIAIVFYTIDTTGEGTVVSSVTRETLLPGVERVFSAPNAANCASSEGFGETEIKIACASAVALMDPG